MSDRLHGGLCGICRHARRVTSRRGSVFLRCAAADEEGSSLPRYPHLPVLRCPAWQPEPPGGAADPEAL